MTNPYPQGTGEWLLYEIFSEQGDIDEESNTDD